MDPELERLLGLASSPTFPSDSGESVRQREVALYEAAGLESRRRVRELPGFTDLLSSLDDTNQAADSVRAMSPDFQLYGLPSGDNLVDQLASTTARDTRLDLMKMLGMERSPRETHELAASMRAERDAINMSREQARTQEREQRIMQQEQSLQEGLAAERRENIGKQLGPAGALISTLMNR